MPTTNAQEQQQVIQNLFQVFSFSDEKLPIFKEIKSKQIISYGESNDYPEKLTDFYNRSGKHNAILTHKARFIGGKQTVIEGGSDEALNMFNKYDSLQELKYKVLLDKKLFGGFCLEVVYNNEKKPSFYHLPIANVRTLDHSSYQYWPKGSKTRPTEVIDYAAFDPENLERTGSGKALYGKQIYYFREYRAGLTVYPLPEYIGAIQYINIDTRISNFHLANISSGFTAGTLIQMFKGELTPEQIRKAKQAFKRNTTGDDNGGAVVLQFNALNEQPAVITNLQPSEMDKQFLQLNEHVQQEIFIGHMVTNPSLLGVKTEGQLGGLTELQHSYEMFYNTYIEPEQMWADAFFTKLLTYMGQKGKVKTEKAEPIGQDYVYLYKSGLITREYAQENMGLPVEDIKQDAPPKDQKTGFAGFDPNQKRADDGEWTDGDEKKKTLEDFRNKNVQQIEELIANEMLEHGIILRDGAATEFILGTKNKIDVPDGSIDRMFGNRGISFTHNHPAWQFEGADGNGGSLSPPDVESLLNWEIGEIRAVDERHVHIMRRVKPPEETIKKNSRGQTVKRGAYRKEIGQLSAMNTRASKKMGLSIKGQHSDKVSFDKAYNKKWYSQTSHETMQEWVNKYGNKLGIEYERKGRN